MYSLGFNPVLIIAAIVPAVVLLVGIYKADKREKVPLSMIASLVFLGILSTVSAGVAEYLGILVLGQFFYEDTTIYNFILYYFIVAVSEEGFKFLLLWGRTWNSHHFKYRFDGIVYAVSVSLGFAVWENIGYVYNYGLQTALLRAVTAVPGHCSFGIFMGMWYGAAKYFDNNNNKESAKKCFLKSIWLPIVIHGTYDFLTSLKVFWFLFIPFIIILFIYARKFVKNISEHDMSVGKRYIPFRVNPYGTQPPSINQFNNYGYQYGQNPYSNQSYQYNPYNPYNQYNSVNNYANPGYPNNPYQNQQYNGYGNQVYNSVQPQSNGYYNNGYQQRIPTQSQNIPPVSNQQSSQQNPFEIKPSDDFFDFNGFNK